MQQLPLAVFLPRGVLLPFGCTPMAHQICLAQHVAAMRYLCKVWLQLNARIDVRECLVKAPATPDITVDMIRAWCVRYCSDDKHALRLLYKT